MLVLLLLLIRRSFSLRFSTVLFLCPFGFTCRCTFLAFGAPPPQSFCPTLALLYSSSKLLLLASTTGSTCRMYLCGLSFSHGLLSGVVDWRLRLLGPKTHSSRDPTAMLTTSGATKQVPSLFYLAQPFVWLFFVYSFVTAILGVRSSGFACLPFIGMLLYVEALELRWSSVLCCLCVRLCMMRVRIWVA